jgi:hypothetical protein
MIRAGGNGAKHHHRVKGRQIALVLSDPDPRFPLYPLMRYKSTPRLPSDSYPSSHHLNLTTSPLDLLLQTRASTSLFRPSHSRQSICVFSARPLRDHIFSTTKMVS